MARIDAPLLDYLDITFFHQLIFETPKLTHFFSRTQKLQTHDKAQVFFADWGVSVTLPQTSDGRLNLGVSCSQSDWQLSSLAQLCSSSFPQVPIPGVEHLYMLEDRFSRLRWLARSVWDRREHWTSKLSDSRLVNVASAVDMVSRENWPECGIRREKYTR